MALEKRMSPTINSRTSPHRPTVCQAIDCDNPIEQNRLNRIRRFCSQKCQKRERRRVLKREHQVHADAALIQATNELVAITTAAQHITTKLEECDP